MYNVKSKYDIEEMLKHTINEKSFKTTTKWQIWMIIISCVKDEFEFENENGCYSIFHFE